MPDGEITLGASGMTGKVDIDVTLIRNGEPIDDPYPAVADDAPLPDGPVIVSLKRLRAEREALFERNTPIGVRLASDQSPEALGGDLERLSLVVLEFPKFRDGRPFSWARMLRTRLRFTGEIRATGDYLYDQIAHMVRVGFDAFELPDAITPDLFKRALGEMTNVYQPSADGRTTIRQLRAR
jgi:uncharacterized protein (DUF934 family)